MLIGLFILLINRSISRSLLLINRIVDAVHLENGAGEVSVSRSLLLINRSISRSLLTL